jgi:S-(hydroxymethyl)glutathione dehydrogenase/alcohol dehydrogenase
MGLTAKGGGCVVTAMGSVMATDVTRNLAGLSLLQKSLQGSLFGGGNPQYDIPEILALYKMGQINLDDMLTREYRLEQINDGYRDMLEGRNIRGVIGSPTPTALAFSLLRPTSSCRCVTWKYIGAQRT